MKIQPREFYEKDDRVVLTLDAGGTNLVFSAMKGAREIVDFRELRCSPNDLGSILATIEDGFREIVHHVDQEIHAISFAFPGPADYRRGIIGDLPNLSAFRGGVALGPFLEKRFGLPVHINNDANLYVLGEYVFGFLPWVNHLLEQGGIDRRYRNLTGITLGSGFGCGIMVNGQLNIGDNSNGGELWLMRNKLFPELCTDASIGQGKIRRMYSERSGIPYEKVPESKEIFHIAMGESKGDREAALQAFRTTGEIIGDALANTSVLVDGLIVIGGGLSGAHALLMPEIMDQLNGTILHLDGVSHPRIAQKAFYLDREEELEKFLRGNPREITIPFSQESLHIDDMPRTGVGISALGANRAISLGAYIYALSHGDGD
jgi:glucokinase